MNAEEFINKQIEEMKTGIGALAEITSIFYNSLKNISDMDRVLLTRVFIDSFLDHIFNPGETND